VTSTAAAADRSKVANAGLRWRGWRQTLKSLRSCNADLRPSGLKMSPRSRQADGSTMLGCYVTRLRVLASHCAICCGPAGSGAQSSGRRHNTGAGSSSPQIRRALAAAAPAARLGGDIAIAAAIRLDAGDGSRRRWCTPAEVQRALTALGRDATRISGSDWPGRIANVDQPELYSWWVDPGGAKTLSEGLGHAIAPGRIYAGQTGATKWPSGKCGTATLASRIGRQHLSGRIRGSTFRLTLASCLVEPLGLVRIAPKRLDSPSEGLLSVWIGDHLDVAVMSFAGRDPLGDLEHHVLAALDPVLNLEGMPRTPARVALSHRRAQLS